MTTTTNNQQTLATQAPSIPTPTPTLTATGPNRWNQHGTTVETLLTWVPKHPILDPISDEVGCRKVGNWSVSVSANGTRYICHYWTTMLVVAQDEDGNWSPVDYSTGHGSVSDQGMMNRLFRALPGCNLYFSRAGGASIVDHTERMRAEGQIN